MYVPSHNRNQDAAQLLAFMRRHSFAALVTATAGSPSATHLPFLVEPRGAGTLLRAHLARANPQAQALQSGGEALVMFQGPHAHVSPRLYQRHPSVPTWNYAAVHASGRVRRLERREDALEVLQGLIAVHDEPYLQTLRELPPDYLQARLDGIVAFEIEVTRLEARWKLSQDRTPAERDAIAAALDASGDAAAAGTAALMRGLASAA